MTACASNFAWKMNPDKARGMKDEMGSIAHAVMATCHENDERHSATVLKYRNCAQGNS